MNNRPTPDVGLELNDCPKASTVICKCGEELTPHSYSKTIMGKYKYYYKCGVCGEKYKV